MTPEALDDLRRLAAEGVSDARIADALGCSQSTVFRWRRRLGIASSWAPPKADHGTYAGYKSGCKCPECIAANAQYRRDWRRMLDAALPCPPNHARPWTARQDAYLMHGPGTLFARARRLGRSVSACEQRVTMLRRREAEAA